MDIKNYYLWYAGLGAVNVSGVGEFSCRTPPVAVSELVARDFDNETEKKKGWRVYQGFTCCVKIDEESFEGSVIEGGEYIPRCKRGDVIEVLDCTADRMLRDFPNSFIRFNKEESKVFFQEMPSPKPLQLGERVDFPNFRTALPLYRDSEICYDTRLDRIGDHIGAIALLSYLQKARPDLKISLIAKNGKAPDNPLWSEDFDLTKWMDFKPHKVYENNIEDSSIPVFNSVKDFAIWVDLRGLAAKGIYPTMKVPRGSLKSKEKKYKHLKPGKYITTHILNAVGVRDTNYVRRRTLDFDKYQKLFSRLNKEGFTILRLGASYDSLKPMDNVVDVTSEDLSLGDSFRLIAKSGLFIGGDTGLKLAASALGVPTIVEIDNESRSHGGLSGCNPKLVTDFVMGASVDELFDVCIEKMSKGKR